MMYCARFVGGQAAGAAQQRLRGAPLRHFQHAKPLPLRATGHRPALEHEPEGRLRTAGVAQSSGDAHHDTPQGAVTICCRCADAQSALLRAEPFCSLSGLASIRQGTARVTDPLCEVPQARAACPGAAAPFARLYLVA